MSLQKSQIRDYKRGWFIGSFSPTLLDTKECEVAMQRYQAGDYEPAHHHKIAVEITLIAAGTARMSGELVQEGEIIRIEPGQSTDFEAVTDVTTVVVKMPCVAGDKYVD